MDAPDVGKHLKDMIGGLVIELATAKALIEQHEQHHKASTEVKAPARDAGEPATET